MLRRGRSLGLTMTALSILAVAACDDEDPTGPNPPATPTGVAASFSNEVCMITWSAVTEADSYIVQRSNVTEGGTFTQVGTPSTGSYTDDTVQPGNTYAYRVIAVGDGGNSGSSDPVLCSVPAPEAPAAPTGLATEVTTDGHIELSWNAVAGADSYRVQRQRVGAGGAFQQIADNVNATSHVDDQVAPGATYNYRVLGVNDAGSSSASDPVEGINEFLVLNGNICDENLADAENCAGPEVVLDASRTYLLSGILRIGRGGILRIPAGTFIVGNLQARPSAVFVERGGQIFSEGTETDPVVFTSQRVVDPELGTPEKGDWAGVVLNGTSYCSFPEEPCVAEGGAGAYGPDGDFPLDLDDDSGVLMYTRIEFAGFEVSFGNELNALTMNAVGRGTEIHHVQTHGGQDDGFEWFGGTVDAKYLLATDISDDSFDFSTGWQGRGQFWIAQQDPNDADAGYEVDGNERDGDFMPFTNPMVYNVTLVGKGPDPGVAGESTTGMLLRRGTAGIYANHIVVGFGGVGLDIDSNPTVTRINDGLMAVTNSILFNNNQTFAGEGDGIDEQNLFTAVWAGNRVADPQLVAPYDRADPDFRPMVGSPAMNGFTNPPADGFFDPVDFIGAIGAGDTEWYLEGWTRWGSGA